MWIMMSDSFLSVVKHHAQPGKLLVRARREGDIEKVFSRAAVTETPDADYRYRAVVSAKTVKRAIDREIGRITYDNFKRSVDDDELHYAYLKVWLAMAELQRNCHLA